MTKTPLSERQKKFCDEYLLDFNGTQAAVRAGYSKKSAKEQGSRLLTKINVQQYLNTKKQKAAAKFEISHERTLQEIGKIAYSNIKSLFNEDGSLKKISDMTDEEACLLSSVEVDEIISEKKKIGETRKVKLWDKTKGLEMLAKHFKIYSDAPVTNTNIKLGYGKEEPV